MTRSKTVTRKPTYRDAIHWIADNDEPTCLDAEIVRGQISTLLVADLFGARENAVAVDVVRCRFYRDDTKGYHVPALYRRAE